MPSNSTEQQLREAMARLLAGIPLHTHGALTVTNLSREAGLSRATANRYSSVLDDFRRVIKDLKGGTIPATDIKRDAADQHVLAQHIQARAMFSRQQERRGSDAVTALPTAEMGSVQCYAMSVTICSSRLGIRPVVRNGRRGSPVRTTYWCLPLCLRS